MPSLPARGPAEFPPATPRPPLDDQEIDEVVDEWQRPRLPLADADLAVQSRRHQRLAGLTGVFLLRHEQVAEQIRTLLLSERNNEASAP